MIQGLVGINDVDGAYWTVAVELAFYVLSAALWFAGFLSDRRLPVTLYAWLAASLALAWVTQRLHLEGLGGVFQNLPWFLVGMLALRVIEGDRRPILIAFVPIALGTGLYFDRASVLGAAVGFTVVIVSLRWNTLGLSSAPLRAASYPLYLLHQNIGYILLLRLHDASVLRWLAVTIAVFFSLAVAFAFTQWVDVPLRRVVRRWITPQPTQLRTKQPGSAAEA
ncbi:hypothetical protein P9139_07485 [Curtobacterium flaccumfaciens]|nr:hypothetical protein P9139_07485 [Curtobacterium flaccumfaciens]